MERERERERNRNRGGGLCWEARVEGLLLDASTLVLALSSAHNSPSAELYDGARASPMWSLAHRHLALPHHPPCQVARALHLKSFAEEPRAGQPCRAGRPFSVNFSPLEL
jgi:hypothetical protein